MSEFEEKTEASDKLIAKNKKQVSISEWKRRIIDCQSSGLSVRKWCTENQISESSYYMHLKGIKESIIEENQIIPISNVISSQSTVVIRTGNINIELTEKASPEQLHAIISALKSC